MEIIETQLKDLQEALKKCEAEKSGQINDALYAVRELNRAVDELAKLIDPKQEDELVKQLIAHQQATTAGKDDVAKKTTACEQLRRDVTAAECEHQNTVATWDAAIKAKLAALPAGHNEPGTAEGGHSVSEHEEKPVESSR